MTDSRRYHRAFIHAAAIGCLSLVVIPFEANAQPRHGMWVYGVVPRSPLSRCTPTTSLLEEDPNAEKLLDFSTSNPITEVYLSLGMAGAALSDFRFPNFVRQLKSGPNALKVEALVGCMGVEECGGNTWRMRIGQVLAYNDRPDPLERFDGLHLDLEPWVGTGTDDYSWVDNLIGYYEYASSAIAGSGLTLAADMSGTKVINSAVTSEQRQALLNLATRMVLMEDEVQSEELVHEHVDRFRNSVDLSTAFFGVGTRVQDFGAASTSQCQNGAVLKGFDDSYTPVAGYSGWSTFKYSDSSDCNHYNDPNVCPDDCCSIPRQPIEDRVQLVLSVDNMNASVSGRESLNGAAEPGRDLLEIDVFDGTKSMRAKNRCKASRVETADRTFTNFLKLFGPLCF
jgi:hypothetical protein